MKAFVVAIPLFDSAMSVQAYLLRDRSGDSVLDVTKGHSRMAGVFSSPGLDLIAKVGPEAFAADKPLIAPINRFQLETGMPMNLDIPPERLVCLLPSDLPHEDPIFSRLNVLQNMGYTLALDGFPYGGSASPLLPYVKYILLDNTHSLFSIHYKGVIDGMKGVTAVITNVPDTETYEKLGSKNPAALFTGAFYNRPITKGISEISPIKVNALQLLNQVNAPDFELSDIVKIIERDPSLSISLLKFINSGAVGLKCKVDSINSAVAILGQNEVRRWATVAISISLAEDRPGEITRISLVRAKFAENLAGSFELGVFQNSLFITGLFSLLDVILQKPMAEAINEVAVDDRVRRTLVDKDGDLIPVMDLIYCYERADWDDANKIMIRNNVTVEAVSGAFVDALVWYDQLLTTIDEEEDAEEAEAMENTEDATAEAEDTPVAADNAAAEADDTPAEEE